MKIIFSLLRPKSLKNFSIAQGKKILRRRKGYPLPPSSPGQKQQTPENQPTCSTHSLVYPLHPQPLPKDASIKDPHF